MGHISAKQKTATAVQLIVLISAILGVWFCIFAASSKFMGGLNALKYFTIQSNIAIAVIDTVALLRLVKRKPASRAWRIVRLAGTVSITLTGSVFCFVLAPTLGENAWNLTNLLTHVIVPVGSVVEFLFSGDGYGLKMKDAPWVLLPPLAYVIYAGICYAANIEFSKGANYPYFFLNWGSPAGAFGFTSTLPFMGCVWWILVLLVLLIVVAELYIFFANHTKKENI